MTEVIQRPSGSAIAAAASRPQHLLLTLLGDFWYRRPEPLPSTALVRVLAQFAVSETNARAAISRLSRKHLLTATRHGRHTSYALTDTAHATLREGTQRIFRFGADNQPWDGQWTVVAFSVPEDKRSLRSALRTRLRWVGFTARFDGVWAAPGDHREDATALLRDLGLTSASIIVGVACGPADTDPTASWDLNDLKRRYQAFVREATVLASRSRDDAMTDAEALISRTTLIDQWRVFPGLDPNLPAELLPADWPATAARNLFTDIYDALGVPATRRFRQLVAIDDPAAALLAKHHTSAEALTIC